MKVRTNMETSKQKVISFSDFKNQAFNDYWKKNLGGSGKKVIIEVIILDAMKDSEVMYVNVSI